MFRHQIITFLTRKGIISPKLHLLSGPAEEKSLAIYRDLALADVSDEYEQALRSFRSADAYWVLPQLPLCSPYFAPSSYFEGVYPFGEWKLDRQEHVTRLPDSLDLINRLIHRQVRAAV